jgi:hypothetical protein
LIKVDVLVGEGRGVTFQPRFEPVDGGSFGDTSGTIECAGGVIGNQNIAGLAVESSVGGRTCLGVLGALAGKSKVNGKTLPGTGSRASTVVTRGLLLEFGSNAGGALVEDRVGVDKITSGITF